MLRMVKFVGIRLKAVGIRLKAKGITPYFCLLSPFLFLRPWLHLVTNSALLLTRFDIPLLLYLTIIWQYFLCKNKSKYQIEIQINPSQKNITVSSLVLSLKNLCWLCNCDGSDRVKSHFLKIIGNSKKEEKFV